MFGVLYWLEPHAKDVILNFQNDFPNHEFIVLQGNVHADKKKPRPLSKLRGMKDFLNQHKYAIYQEYTWGRYQKPVVVGRRICR